MSTAQTPDPQARRVDDRLRALQQENQQLAREATTLLGDLRKLEIQRDIHLEEWRNAELVALEAQHAVATASERLTDLEKDLQVSRRLTPDTWRQRSLSLKVREQFWALFGEIF